MKAYRLFLNAVLGLLFVSANLKAQKVENDSVKNWYQPQNTCFQFAGNIGMFSCGPSWTFLKEHLALTTSIGYVPRFFAEKAIYIFSIKAMYSPNRKLHINDKLNINPLNLGFVVSHTLGNKYNKYLDFSKYSAGYYWWVPPLRSGLLYEIETNYQISKRYINKFGLYFQISF